MSAAITLPCALNLEFRLCTLNFGPMSQFGGFMGISEAETSLCLLRSCVAVVSEAPLGEAAPTYLLVSEDGLAKRDTRVMLTAR